MQAEKQKVELETYNVGDTVYAISRWCDEGKDTDHVAIYQEQITEVSTEKLSRDGEWEIKYWFKKWGMPVDSSEVNADFYTLVNKMKKEWEKG